MICGELRELLFAFLDNELDAALSIDVQRHLEHCPDCAREAEMERNIQKRLAAAMDKDALHAQELENLWSAALSSNASHPVRGRPRTRRWLSIMVGVAATIALGFFVQRWVIPIGGLQQPDSLVNLLIADFDHFLSEGRSVQIASADRREVARWLLTKTGLTVSLPAMSGGHCKLMGARKCKLNGQPAAFASYEMDTNPACLVVLAGDTDALSSMKQVSRDGRTFWVDRCKDHAVVACRRDALIYAAVSRTHEDELLHFLSELE